MTDALDQLGDLLPRMTNRQKARMNVRVCLLLDRRGLLDEENRLLAAAIAIRVGVRLPSGFVSGEDYSALWLAVQLGYCDTADPAFRAEMLELARKLLRLNGGSEERRISIHDQLHAALDDL